MLPNCRLPLFLLLLLFSFMWPHSYISSITAMTQSPYAAAFTAPLLTNQPPPTLSHKITTGWNRDPDYCILPKAVFFCVSGFWLTLPLHKFISTGD
ncbi:hypothetical protein L208DRAFT_1411457 [Tricholoma matsutake]|nr:hypothetical protein L208DRAFT_1411457 [Tricholoma matsutake 945]